MNFQMFSKDSELRECFIANNTIRSTSTFVQSCVADKCFFVGKYEKANLTLQWMRSMPPLITLEMENLRYSSFRVGFIKSKLMQFFI